MNRKIKMKDNIYLSIPFIVMTILYYSSSMSYESQSIVSSLEKILINQPFINLLSKISFIYDKKLISINHIGYFSFIEFFIRKGMHFFIFFIIGFFWYLGLRKRVHTEYLTIILSVMLSVGYASFDELRQAIHPNRTGSLVDVRLDTAGAIIGIVIAYLLIKKRILKE